MKTKAQRNSLLSAKRKGKSAKRTEYHHDGLWMIRKTQKEDIEEDTRDPVSLLVWLMSRDYENQDLLKATININQEIYTLVGKVVHRSSLVENGIETRLIGLRFLILGRDEAYHLKS